MTDIGNMISKLRKERGWTQDELADRIHLTKQTICNYEKNRRTPPYPTLEAIADVLNVPMGMFLTEEEQRKALAELNGEPYEETFRIPSNIKPISQIHRQRIPLIGEVAAGQPILAEEDWDVFVDAPVNADYALRVKGDSMIPTLQDGDIIYIKQQPDAHDGQIAVVLMDDDAAVKHIYHRRDGLDLLSENPQYAPIHATPEEFDVIRILGVVCGFTRMFAPSVPAAVTKGFKKK